MKRLIQHAATGMLTVALSGICWCTMTASLEAAPLPLATNGATVYRVVEPANPSTVDAYAARCARIKRYRSMNGE